MRRLIRLAAHLYPAAWRRRYQAEFAALLVDVDAGWRVLFNVLGGALEMQMHIWHFRKILVAGMFIGAMVGLSAWFALPRHYTSSGLLAVAALSSNPTAALNDLEQVFQDAFGEPALAAIVRRLNLYEPEQGERPLSDLVGEMRKSILVKPIRAQPTANTNLFSIQFFYRDPVLAQRTAEMLIESLLDSNLTQHLRLKGSAPPYSVEVLRAPRLPDTSVGPNLWVLLSSGIAAGLIIGTVFAIQHRLRHAPSDS